jgi:hypothetical protein
LIYALSLIVLTSPGRESHLAACLEMLNRQRFRDFETIVVDDGSELGESCCKAFQSQLSLRYFWSGNFAINRADFEKVDGFNTCFRGWGLEDIDLGIRLMRAGISIDFCLDTWSEHQLHPEDCHVRRSETNLPLLTSEPDSIIPAQVIYYHFPASGKKILGPDQQSPEQLEQLKLIPISG